MDIKEKEFISGLTRMGLTQYEARIYTTLTSNGILSAKELSDICGIPYGKTYEVINSLAKKGFVVVLPVKPMKYKAMDCQEVLKMLKTDLFKNFESAEGVMDSMKSMQKQDSANESKGSFWVLHGRGAINQKIEGLIKNSKKTLIMFLPGNVHFRIGYFAELLKIKKAEGIDISVLATKRIDSKLCSELGCSIVSDINQPLKSSFISADSTESLIFEAIPDDTNYTEGVDTGISILESSTTTFLEAMYSMFKNYKSLLMENDDVLFITDYKTHNILELNQKAEDIIGLPREEIIGKNLRSLPHFSEKFKHLFTEVSKELSTKKALNFNNLEIELNGKKIYLSITAKLLKFYGKSAILTIAKNITPEKIAKAEKEGIQNEYKNLFNMSPLPTFLVSKDDRVMMSNNAAQELSQELYGCRLDSNSDFSKIFSPEQFKHISKERSKHIKKEGISTFDLDVVTPKGKKEFRVTYSAPNTEGSRVIVARDLSVLKHLKKEGRSVRKELRESEKKHKTLFESSSDAIMTLAPPQWKFTNGNPATIKMFKAKDEAEFNSKGPWELSPRYQPDGQISEVKAKQMIMNAMKEGSNFFEWTHKRINGEEFPATVLLTKIERCGRELLQATVRDITEQKKAEDALKFGSLILNNINDSVIVTDIDGKIKSWNLGSVRIFGYSAEEMIGKSIVQVTKPEERESVAPKQLESLRNGDMHFREWEGVRKDGSPVWLLLSTNIMSNSTGKTVGMVGIGKDITNHKKTEEMLNEHKNVFDTVLNNSSDAIFLIGSDHKYKWINKKCGEIMNLDPNEYIGKTAGISIHEEDKQKSIQNFKSAMNGEIVKYQARLHSLDGRIRHLDIRLQSLTCDGEKCVLGFASETSKNNFITP